MMVSAQNDHLHVSYPTVDHFSYLVLSQGRGAFLVKTDIKEAYQMVPVHVQDQCLLVQWKDNTYVDLALLFGLHSALIMVADAIQWILV